VLCGKTAILTPNVLKLWFAASLSSAPCSLSRLCVTRRPGSSTASTLFYFLLLKLWYDM